MQISPCHLSSLSKAKPRSLQMKRFKNSLMRITTTMRRVAPQTGRHRTIGQTQASYIIMGRYMMKKRGLNMGYRGQRRRFERDYELFYYIFKLNQLCQDQQLGIYKTTSVSCHSSSLKIQVPSMRPIHLN
ncbi:hypothetical protein FGO68_gene12096 [Halteria grandinella]|uniref:Uncharacterized protein n=1 Tax=Halteria grandinella TaxID=5974 RepID=A0A8J8N9C1_HALGN|nr:hypothetical protein FGO68_gene12096 [Halteria grandinella]